MAKNIILPSPSLAKHSCVVVLWFAKVKVNSCVQTLLLKVKKSMRGHMALFTKSAVQNMTCG